MDDIRAVAYGHAVSSLGYDVKLGKSDLVWKDGKHSVTWEVRKNKAGVIEISRKSRKVKLHKGDEELDDHKLEIIDGLVLKCMQVLRISAEFVKK